MGVYRLGVNDIDLAIKVCIIFNSIKSDKEKVHSFLSDSKNYLLVYMVGEEVAGYAYGYELQRFDGKNSMMYIHAIEVIPEYRKQGIGTRIINEIADICRKNGFIKMFLITFKSNIPAVSLYESTNGKAKHDDYVVFDYEIS